MQLLHTFFLKKITVKRALLLLILFYSHELHSQQTDSVNIQSLFGRGWSYLYSDADSASFYFEKGKRESETRQYYPGIVLYYNYNAALQIASGRIENAFKSYDQAIAFAQKKDRSVDLGFTYIKRGILNEFMGEYNKAAEDYLAAASILKTNEYKKEVIGLYSNIIATTFNLKQQNQSLQNVLPALRNDNTGEKEIVAILSQKSTHEPMLDFLDETTLRDITGGKVYVIFGGAKFSIADFYILGRYSNYRSVHKIPDGVLASIPDIPRDGTILEEANDKTGRVWLVKDKKRHLVENPQVLQFFGGWDAKCTVPEQTLEQIPDAGDIVTMQNVLTTFNFRKEYELLVDTLKSTLHENNLLLAEVGKKLKAKNNTLQKRKTLLWTSLIGIVALLSIGFLLFRNSRQKQKLHEQTLLNLKKDEELQRKEALEKERTRIASDMHDDLGAGLTRIKFIAEDISEKTNDAVVTADMKRLRSSSIELVENMAEIIWAMNEKNNTLEDLVFYLRSYSVDYCNENNLVCEFNLPENIPHTTIGGQVRRNIFLVLKEALHNIVKHAAAKKVIVDLHANDKLVLSIADDGRGFLSVLSQNGNGLLNMRQRAATMDGKFEIINNGGTIIRLEVPL